MKLIDDDREAETTINNLSKKSPNEIHAGGFLSPSDALAYTGVDDKKNLVEDDAILSSP